MDPRDGDPLTLPETAGELAAYQAGVRARHHGRGAGFVVAILVGLAFALGYAAGHADAASRPAPESVPPAVAQELAGAPTMRLEKSSPEDFATSPGEAKRSAPPRPAAELEQLRGTASWYCLIGVSRCTRGHADGMYAAIRRDLLFLRGHQVTVCAARCVAVTIIDCNCGPNANLIDLYSDAFRLLAPLSRGIVDVTVSWVVS